MREKLSAVWAHLKSPVTITKGGAYIVWSILAVSIIDLFI